MSYEKECNNELLTRFSKRGDLMRTVEKFDSGNWVVAVWKGKDLSGEYTDKEFQEIRSYFD